MIEMNDYIEKLEALKEYMGFVIDGPKPIFVDLVVLERRDDFSVAEILKLFNCTGIIYCKAPNYHEEPTCRDLTFEEYCQSKEFMQLIQNS